MNQTELNAVWRLLGACEAAGTTGTAYKAMLEMVTKPDRPEVYGVQLVDHGAQKIAVIKAIREITHLGLKEAKTIADSAPATVIKCTTLEIASSYSDKLRQAGAITRIDNL